MEYINLIISIAALIFSLFALIISYHKLKISKEELKLSKMAHENELERYESSRSKKIEVFINQEGTLDLSKDRTHLKFEIRIINKSDFAIKMDTVFLSIIGEENRELADKFNHFENFVIDANDKYEKVYYVGIDLQKIPFEIFYKPIKAVVTDKEGDVFESSPTSIDVQGVDLG